MYVLMILTSLLNFVPMWRYAEPHPSWQLLLSAVLAVFLVGTCFIALGEFLSTLTKNQIIAGMLSFCLALVTWVLSYFDSPMASTPMKVLTYLSVLGHMQDMAKGVIDSKDVVFYASFIGFALVLTQQSVESRRWRE
jgi:ABC-2 type transport system permease protein